MLTECVTWCPQASGTSDKDSNNCVIKHGKLPNRKQQIVLNGVSSDLKKLRTGVPKGSVFGPLLF